MRQLIAGLGICALLVSSASAQSPALLVLNKEDATLAVIDIASGKTTATIATGAGPHEVAVSEDGRTAFVTNYGSADAGNTLSVIDLGGRREAARVDLGVLRRPHGVAVSRGRVYFTSEAAREVGRYDPATRRVDGRYPTGQDGTHMVVLTRDGNTLFTSNIGSNTVTVSTFMDARPTHIPVGRGPEGLDLSPDGRELWVAHSQDGGVSIIDTATRTVTRTFDAGTKRSNRLKFTPDGRLVLISDLDAGELVVVDARTHAVTRRVPLGRMPEGILVQPDGAAAYVAVAGERKVAVIDLKTLAVARTIETGNGPDGMAWVSVSAGRAAR